MSRLLLNALCITGTMGLAAEDVEKVAPLPVQPPLASTMALTFTDLRERGIVTLLDQEIHLRARLLWEYPTVSVPEQTLKPGQAGPLTASFDEPAFATIKGRKTLRIDGAPTSVAGADGKQGYACGGTTLINGQVYILIGTLRLRPTFKAEQLKNPVFVTQSNDPRYWSQTFAFDLRLVE